MTDRARNILRRHSPILAALALFAGVSLEPISALAQGRGMGGGFGGGGFGRGGGGFGGGGFGGGGMGGGGMGGGLGLGLGLGGALLGGAAGQRSREPDPAEDADEAPPPRSSRPRIVRDALPPVTTRSPKRVAEPPKRVVEPPARRPKPVVTQRPVEEPEAPIKPSRKRPVIVPPPKIAKTPPPAPVTVAKPQRPLPAPKSAKAPPPRIPPAIRPAPPPAIAALPPAAEQPGIVPGEVLIELKADAPPGTLARLAVRERLDIVASESFALVPVTLHRATIRDGRNVAALVRALQADPQVASAQANHAYQLVADTPALPFASVQYAVGKLRLDAAHATATGKDIGVAVIDSGVDASHPALAGAVTESWDAIAKSAAKPGTGHAHGTAVAAIVGARAQLASAAPEARLLAIRAFSGGDAKAGAQGTTLHILRAIDKAASAGARVVNMSFAGPADDKLAQFFAAGAAKGFVYVAAAGNGGAGSAPLFPAADPNVIAVTATDAQDRLFPAANRGGHVAVAAPGVDIFVAAPGGGYALSSGTSMAAPQVAGIVAMMLQIEPTLTPAAVREGLTKSARDLGDPGPDPEFGAGSADANEALRAVDPRAVPAGAAVVSAAKPLRLDGAKAEPAATEGAAVASDRSPAPTESEATDPTGSTTLSERPATTAQPEPTWSNATSR